MIPNFLSALKTTWDKVINDFEPAPENDTSAYHTGLLQYQQPQQYQQYQPLQQQHQKIPTQSWIRNASQSGRRRTADLSRTETIVTDQAGKKNSPPSILPSRSSLDHNNSKRYASTFDPVKGVPKSRNQRYEYNTYRSEIENNRPSLSDGTRAGTTGPRIKNDGPLNFGSVDVSSSSRRVQSHSYYNTTEDIAVNHSEDKQNHKRPYDYIDNKSDNLYQGCSSLDLKKRQTASILKHSSNDNPQSPAYERLYPDISQHEPSWGRLDKDTKTKTPQEEVKGKKYQIESVSLSDAKRQRTGYDFKQPVYQAPRMIYRRENTNQSYRGLTHDKTGNKDNITSGFQIANSTPRRRENNDHNAKLATTATTTEEPSKYESITSYLKPLRNIFSNPTEQENKLSYDSHIRAMSQETPFKVNSKRYDTHPLKRNGFSNIDYQQDSFKDAPLRGDKNLEFKLDKSEHHTLSSLFKPVEETGNNPYNGILTGDKVLKLSPEDQTIETATESVELKNCKEEVKMLRSRTKRLEERIKEKDILLEKYHDQYLKNRRRVSNKPVGNNTLPTYAGKSDTSNNRPSSDTRPVKKSTLIQKLQPHANGISLDNTKNFQLNQAGDSKAKPNNESNLATLSPIKLDELKNL
ncbi:hypothetical protein NADFUDRAFT_50847 [Nadsonia fulvescens var. elongata DSM 6958]|uniref:Uncharacterized protein n=1 Tax=Nadsonia fulvescens var. elongata DSM 6958 TaxID=857566 RepID=A0A1E3PJF9_9ASCO|nr:hypothetical protein NADFUDRAFT_50847 [Nadsonia fulvescens var. elongata DSM 6958]